MVRPSTSPFGPSLLPPRPAHGRLVNSPKSSSNTRSWSDAAALHLPYFSGGLEPGKQLSPPYILIFLGKWVGGFVPLSMCSEPKEGKVLPCSSHLIPSSLTLWSETDGCSICISVQARRHRCFPGRVVTGRRD